MRVDLFGGSKHNRFPVITDISLVKRYLLVLYKELNV